MIELVDSARELLGRSFLRHHEVVPDCWSNKRSECFATGLGPDSFDCSGLVIVSLCKALYIPTARWSRQIRHVREFWNDGIPALGSVRIANEDIDNGDLLIFKKRISVENIAGFYPCHMGIAWVSETEGLGIIHTSLSTRTVVEEALSEKNKDRLLGAIKLDEHKLISTLDT